MSMSLQPDRMALVRRNFIRSNKHFDAHAAVFHAVADQLQDRLSHLAIKPAKVLDLGSRTGYRLDALQRCYPEAHIIGADPAPMLPMRTSGRRVNWWPRRRKTPDQLACDPHDLPFADSSLDLVVCNLFLPWCHAPERVFAEIARVLSPGGAFMFTTLGPDTLIEYRRIWSSIDTYEHAFGLVDMHTIGDSLLTSGFAAPVLDRDEMVVDYPSIDALQFELRCLGALNVSMGRRHGLMAPSVLELLTKTSTGSPRFSVTLELVHGHGWKGELMPKEQNSRSEYRVSLDSLRNSLSTRN